MKTYIIVVIAILGIASTSHAQKVMLGPRIGMDIGAVAWDSTSYGTNKSAILGLIGGAQLDIWFSGHVALSTGILLDQKGWQEYNMDYPRATNDLTLNYIEVPLFVKVGFGAGSFQPYVFAGPSFGYLFWGYTRQDWAGEAFRIDEELNTFDFSIVGGAGLAYNLPGGAQIFVDGGYAFGFSNITKSSIYYDGAYQNYFNVGYWPLKPVGAIRTRDIRIATGILFPI